jgi:hypothetical protein
MGIKLLTEGIDFLIVDFFNSTLQKVLKSQDTGD